MDETRSAQSAVLVVEDEPQLLRLISRILVKHGHEVRQAADGGAASEVLSDGFKPDLAVIDLSVPPEGGASIMRSLQTEHPHTKILLTSGAEPDEGLRAELETLQGSFLRKPFSPRTLSTLAERVLAGESFPRGLA